MTLWTNWYQGWAQLGSRLRIQDSDHPHFSCMDYWSSTVLHVYLYMFVKVLSCPSLRCLEGKVEAAGLVFGDLKAFYQSCKNSYWKLLLYFWIHLHYGQTAFSSFSVCVESSPWIIHGRSSRTLLRFRMFYRPCSLENVLLLAPENSTRNQIT